MKARIQIITPDGKSYYSKIKECSEEGYENTVEGLKGKIDYLFLEETDESQLIFKKGILENSVIRIEKFLDF